MPRAQKAEGAHQAPAKKATQAISKDASREAPRKEPAKKAAAKPAAKISKEASKTPAKAAKPAKTAAPRHTNGDEAHDNKFLDEQRELLLAEREEYLQKADELKAEADSLARETEPGDIQFDEEGGEGGTASIDREVDLVLSAQARAAVEEIDRALHKIEIGTYGVCENCNQPIPKARLKALPYAALCVQCKSGGLSRR